MEAVPNGYSAIYVNTAVFDPEKEELSALMNCFLQDMVEDKRFPRLPAFQKARRRKNSTLPRR